MILCGRAEQSPAPTGLGMQKGDRRYKGTKEEVGEVDDFMWKGGMVLVILREGRAEPCPYGVGMQKGDTRKQQGIQRKQQGDIKKQKGGCKRKSGKREKKNRQYRQS